MVCTNKYAKILVQSFPEFAGSKTLAEEYEFFGEDDFNAHALLSALTNYVANEVIKENEVVTDFEIRLYTFIESYRAKFKLSPEDTEEGEFDNAVCTCFLENLLNRASRYNELYDRFIPYLGPNSIEFCKAWDKFTGVPSPGLWTEEEWFQANKSD